MKVTKKRMQKWKSILPLIEAERGTSVNPSFIDALDFCMAIIGNQNPDLTLSQSRNYIIEIEDRINYFIYNTTDILKTNALMECADIIRDYSKIMIENYNDD